MPLATELLEIRPISDLRTHLGEVEDLARESQQPVVLTRNGAAALVLMDASAYNESIRHERAVRKLQEAEIEARYTDKTYEHDEVWSRVDDIIAAAEALNA